MKQFNRRQFGKVLGVAVVTPMAAGLVPNVVAAFRPPFSNRQAEAPKPELPPQSGQAALKLTKEQEEALKKAVERRERQLGALRSRTLAYDLEPAFVFQVRQRPRSGRRTAGGGEP